MVCNGLIKVNLIDDTSKINVKMIDNSSKIDVKLTDYNDKGIRDDIEELKETKVDKIEGKSLSTNDYTNEEKEKLSTLENYDDSEVRELIDTKQPRGNYITQETDPTVPNHVKNITQNDITSWNNKADMSDIPDVSNFVTKDVNNLTYYTLKTNTGSLIDLEVNQSTYVVTLKLKNSDGTVISTDAIDLPLETVVVGGSYDSQTKEVVLTLDNGNEVRFSVADLVSGLQSEITSSNKLASDLVDDSNSGNKFTTTSEKQTWNGKYAKPNGGIPKTDLASSVQSSLDKADTAIQNLTPAILKDGGSATQTIALSSGTGTTAFAVKSRSTSSYISFSNSNGWLGSYGVGTDKKPTYYNGTGYTIAYTTDIPTKTSQLTNNSNYVADASYIHTDNNYTNTDKSKVDNLQKSLVNASSPTPNFDGMTPIASYEFDIADTNYHPIYTLPNTGLSFTNFKATVGYRITVTGSDIEQIVDIIDEWHNPASYPLTTAINRTLSTSAATTGFRYLRAVYPTSTYINDTNYPLGQEISCYNSTARHFVVDVFRQPSDISWKSTADTSIYVNSTHNGNSPATIYSTRGWIYRSPASFVASSASSATYASGYEPATVGVGSLKTGAAAISAAHIAYLADDNLVYDISDTTKNIALGFTKIGLITNAVAKKTAISQTYFRSATPLSSTNLGTISHDTLSLGKRMFLRCTMDDNGNIHSDNYIATTMGAGYTWMPIGVATSSSAGYMDTRSQHFYTLDANGKLTHIDGLEIASNL